MDDAPTSDVDAFKRTLDELANVGIKALGSSASTQKRPKPSLDCDIHNVGKGEEDASISSNCAIGYVGECHDENKTTTCIQCLSKAFAEAVTSKGLIDVLRHNRSFCLLCYEMLNNDSLLDIAWKTEMYQALFALLLQVAAHPETCMFFVHPLTETRTVTCLQLLSVLESQANVFIQLHTRKQVTLGKRSGPLEAVDVDESMLLANNIVSIVKETKRSLCHHAGVGNYESANNITEGCGGIGDTKALAFMEQPIAVNATPSSANMLETERAAYVPLMLPHRFAVVDMCSLVAAGDMSHVYHAEATSRRTSASSNPQQRMVRIAKEMATLSTTLPVEFGSSVFLRVDESRSDLIKALIVGPLGTPYANGCFEFDILLPSDYPHRPPYVTLVTTGKGTVSFNPFFSEDGYICLSLFNTSDGPSKDWNAERSTLLQVLVSLQSLVMVPEPYYTDATTVRNEDKSSRYSRKVRQNCMRWAILEQIKTPSMVFQDAIRAHFRNKRLSLKQQLQEWSLDCSSCSELTEKIVEAMDTL